MFQNLLYHRILLLEWELGRGRETVPACDRGNFFLLFKGSSLKVVCFTNCGPELNYIIPSSCKGGWEMQFNCGSRRKGKGVWWIQWQSIPMGALYSTYPLVSCLLAFFYLPLLTQTTYLHGFYDMEDSCLVLFL